MDGGGIALLILDLDTKCKEWLASGPAGLPRGKTLLYPLNKLLFGLVTRFGQFGEEKNKDVLLQPGIEPQFLVRSAHSLVAIVTAQPKFRTSIVGLKFM